MGQPTRDGTINAIAGPERLVLRTPVALYGEDLKTVGEFAVEAGQSVPFVLSYGSSFQILPPAIDPFMRWNAPRRSGVNGAPGVPMSGRGRRRSSARSSR